MTGEPMVRSSLALLCGRVANMAFGFVFWVVASRAFAAHDVGVGAGAVAALLLCVQLALVGLDSSVIHRYPGHRHSPGLLIGTAGTLVAGASVATGTAFLLVAIGFFDELQIFATHPLRATLFVATIAVAAVAFVLDQISMAQGRGQDVLVRSCVNGLGRVVPLLLMAVLGLRASPSVMVLLWLCGAAAAAALGLRHVRRPTGGEPVSLAISARMARELAGSGASHHALTLADRLPGLVVPIIVLELLSPADNATWYACWMIAMVVHQVPLSMGIGLFAEVSDHPDDGFDDIVHATQATLSIALPLAIGTAVLAPHILGVLGQSYAQDGTTPLRILMVGVVPLGLLHVHYAVCRARAALREAIGIAGLVGTTTVVGAWLVAPRGLEAVAATSVAAVGLGGAVAAHQLAQHHRPVAVAGTAS